MLDTALCINGDFDKDENNNIFFISGNEEVKQKLYIMLSMKKGSFIYDRELGSGLYKCVDDMQQIEAEARKALSRFPEAEVTGVSAQDGMICVSVMYNGENYDINIRGMSN